MITMKKIITLGEIMLRLSAINGDRLMQASHLTVQYGGAEANVAVSLSNFGHQVFFVSKVPDNSLGSAARRQLQSNGVHTDFLIEGGERLGTYYLEVGVGQRNSKVTYDRKYSSFSSLQLNEFDWNGLFQGADLFHISGITPAVAPSLKELTLYTIKKARELGVKVSFDFNYRQKLWSHKEASETITALLPYVDICFCGELDLVYILGLEKSRGYTEQSTQLKYLYSKLIESYSNINYISSTFRNSISTSTNTLQGNYYVNNELYQSKVYSIDHIVDRVGGGDAFAAGILHGILENIPPQELIEFATGASVLKHTVNGDYNLFSTDEINSFIQNGAGSIAR
jgi:2-dehydro-3-deoxygluconokinase